MIKIINPNHPHFNKIGRVMGVFNDGSLLKIKFPNIIKFIDINPNDVEIVGLSRDF